MSAGPVQTTGTPLATTNISGDQLPAPDLKFGGVFKGTGLESKAWWPYRVVPPKKAPNILLIMTDDAFGVFEGVRGFRDGFFLERAVEAFEFAAPEACESIS